jgi:hypothetical protein
MRAAVLVVFLLTAGADAAPLRTHAADALLPGYGSFSTGHPVSGTIQAAGRVGTAYLAYYFRQREIEYRSAENSAKIAELYFGPGYRFRNPYGKGYYNSAEYRRLAGRREFFWNLSLVLHAGLLITGQAMTAHYYDEMQLERAPVFKEARAEAVLFSLRF